MTTNLSIPSRFVFFFGVLVILSNPLLAYSAQRTSAGSGKWSNPKVWVGEQVPHVGDQVIIRKDHRVTYDQSLEKPLAKIIVQGSLEFHAQKSLELITKGNLIVTGELKLNPASPKYRHEITFTGIDESKYIGGGMKVKDSDVGLWVMDTGILKASGSTKTSWTRLRTGAKANQTVIDVEDASGWQVGDRLEIIPTLPPSGERTSWQGYDSVKITAVNGNKVSFEPALQYDHPIVNKRWAAEVLNLTRNVVIQGTPQGRAHTMFMIARPQHIKNIEIRHMGPRKQAGRYTKGVLGRYALHFHLSGEGSRGSLVENVVIHDAGNHAFVPHGSHGIIMRNCVSHNTWDDAYWWDPGYENRTDDTRWEHCVASKVRSDPPFRGYRLTGFNLGQGANNRITNCVAVGVQGSGDSAGFVWPERPNGKEGIWFFQNNLGHNNKRNGIFTWQNTGQLHLVEKFALYHNGTNGIEHGAYTNSYFYRDAVLYGNANAGIQLHANSAGGRQLKFKNIEIDGADISKYGGEVIKHVAAGRQPTWIENCAFRDLRKSAVAFTYSGKESKIPERVDIVNCSFPKDAKRFFLSKKIHPDSLITVEEKGGKIFELRRFDQTGQLVPQWNARKKILQKTAKQPAKVKPVQREVSERWPGSDGKAWPKRWDKFVLTGAAPSVTIEKNQGLVRSSGSKGVVLMSVANSKARDVDQQVTFRISTNIPLAGLFARRPDSDKDTFYGAEAGTGRAGIRIYKHVHGKYHRLVQLKKGVQANKDYRMRFQVTSRERVTDLRLKVWKAEEKEPSSWTLELRGDTERKLRGQSGRFGIITTQGGNQGRRVWYDNYQAESVEY